MTISYLRPYRGSWRPIAFLSIGLGCFVLQLAILVTLVHIGIPRTEANALGFLASAQVKFVLSCQFVWSDRRARRGGFWQRFAAFNATTFVAFIANTVVFAASNGTAASWWEMCSGWRLARIISSSHVISSCFGRAALLEAPASRLRLCRRGAPIMPRWGLLGPIALAIRGRCVIYIRVFTAVGRDVGCVNERREGAAAVEVLCLNRNGAFVLCPSGSRSIAAPRSAAASGSGGVDGTGPTSQTLGWPLSGPSPVGALRPPRVSCAGTLTGPCSIAVTRASSFVGRGQAYNRRAPSGQLFGRRGCHLPRQ